MYKEMEVNELLAEARKMFKEAEEATEEQFIEMIEDLKFLDGEQWNTTLEADRNKDGRPCLVINKLPTFLDRITGDQRQNRPGIKVKPVDSEADPETAEVLTGLIRNIEVQSDADQAYDTAFDSAVACGLGVLRIITEYEDDENFDQVLELARVKNPFACYFDPMATRFDKSDGQFCFQTEKIRRGEFERKYPNADSSEFNSNRDDYGGWVEPDHLRVAEFWVKDIVKSKVYLIQYEGETEPEVVTELPSQEAYEDDSTTFTPRTYAIIKEREAEGHKILWYRISYNDILEGPIEWPSKYFPLIPVLGKEINIENQSRLRGIVRHAKDPQRLYNYNRSMGAETVALAPRMPYIVTPAMVAGFQNQWDSMHKRNYNYLLANVDIMAPGLLPQRQSGAQVATGIQNEVIVSDQELHDTVGLQPPAIGKRGRGTSGKAIEAEQRGSEIGQSVFGANLVRALKHAGRVLVDMIPRIYDVERIVTILNEDGTDKQVPVNQQFKDENTGKDKKHDLTIGKYDVVVSVGPSYQTQREEAAEGMINLIQAIPDVGPLVMDLAVQMQDWPYADEIAKRLKKTIPKEITEEVDEEGGQPQPEPPPDPMQQVQMQAAQLQLQEAQVKIEQEKAELLKIQAELEKIQAETRKIGAETEQGYLPKA